MDLDKVGRFLRDVGFPVAVAVYLLVRLDLLIRDNTAALWALQQAVWAILKHQ